MLADLPAYEAAMERMNPEAPVRLFFNPRRWDEQMHTAHGRNRDARP